MTLDLSKFIFIDHHAHSLLRGHLQLDAISFRQCFSESRSIGLLEEHLFSSVHFLDMLNKLGALVGKSDEAGVLEYRSGQPEHSYVKYLWDDCSIGALIVDDGFRTGDMISVEHLAHLCGRPVFRCARIEPLLENSIAHAGTFTELSGLFDRALQDVTQAGVVALKTIAAYRGGLDIENVSVDEARLDFDKVKAGFSQGSPGRIERCRLYHHLLARAFEFAGSRGLPVQLHAGIGDDDEDLREANPLCMRRMLHSQQYSQTQFVFLHCYPFVREASYLASIYPNVFIDLSLSVTLASPAAEAMVAEALAAAPTSKVLAGTDGHSVPEAHWYGARRWKQGLERVLRDFVSERLLTSDQAGDIAARILHENARRLYQLEDLV